MTATKRKYTSVAGQLKYDHLLMHGKPTKPFTRSTFSWLWLAVPLVLLAVYELLGLFDRATEITPSHDTSLNACFAIGGLAALLFAGVGVFGRQKMNVVKRTILALALAMIGFVSIFLLSDRVTELVENHIDFPPSDTTTHLGFLRIGRAYQTHGKGAKLEYPDNANLV